MSGRVRFANHLRGLAALSVAASHLVAIYWALPDVVSAFTYTPNQTGAAPWFFGIVSNAWFNPGPFGVAVFFLISGMVVPFSLQKHTRSSFLAARVLRIFPTYAVALLIEFTVLHITADGYGRPFGISPAVLLSNLVLVYDLVGRPSMDLVNWTLSVEWKFYVVVALIAPMILRGRATALLVAGACILAGNFLLAEGIVGDQSAVPSTITYTLSSQSIYVLYMMIGTAFNFHLRRLISTAGLVALVAVLAAMFLGAWRLGILRDQYPVVTLNYGYALVLFAALYAVRDRVPANPVLDGMAAISFPFYVLHSLMGYLALRLLMGPLGVSYYLALPVTLVLVATAAWVLHVMVERPTADAGQHFAPSSTLRHAHGNV